MNKRSSTLSCTGPHEREFLSSSQSQGHLCVCLSGPGEHVSVPRVQRRELSSVRLSLTRQSVCSYTGWPAHSLIATFLWMEGSNVQGTFRFCGNQSFLSGKLSEICGPLILEGFITLELIQSPMSYHSYPLVVLSLRVLHNFADMACEFHPKNIPLLHGTGYVQELDYGMPTETCLTFSQTLAGSPLPTRNKAGGGGTLLSQAFNTHFDIFINMFFQRSP